ncbi:uncharacterized protein BDZ99DRAFT_559411, partial [Mytilinidion resinicola]
RFNEWLRTGRPDSNVFWISGRPGSGKSTLMKYLWRNTDVEKGLQGWAGDRTLIRLNFFFWAAGSSLEKSRKGLLRSLLFQILRRVPNIIRIVCHEKLKEAKRSIDGGILCEGVFWEESELVSTLIDVVEKAISSPFCLCFFMDGLDEYDGSSLEIVGIIKRLAEIADVKLYIASRPLSIFGDHFGQDDRWNLPIHKLTEDDIRLYTRDTLEANKTFRHISQNDGRYQDLVAEIVENAHGVFLWVTLVIRSLLVGITAKDQIEFLQGRFRDIPQDLNDMYEQILKKIDPVYKAHAAKIFLILAYQGTTLNSSVKFWPVLMFYYLDAEVKDFSVKLAIQDVSEDQVLERYNETCRTINKVCSGLVEAAAAGTEKRKYWNYLKPPFFIHQSAKEYLQAHTTSSFLRSGIP